MKTNNSNINTNVITNVINMTCVNTVGLAYIEF